MKCTCSYNRRPAGLTLRSWFHPSPLGSALEAFLWTAPHLSLGTPLHTVGLPVLQRPWRPDVSGVQFRGQHLASLKVDVSSPLRHFLCPCWWLRHCRIYLCLELKKESFQLDLNFKILLILVFPGKLSVGSHMALLGQSKLLRNVTGLQVRWRKHYWACQWITMLWKSEILWSHEVSGKTSICNDRGLRRKSISVSFKS